MTGRLQVVVGGQYGSEAKGHIAGRLAHEGVDLAIRVAGPNAGHSVVDPKTGAKFALRQVPVAAVTNPNTLLAIGAGSEIDPRVLQDEVKLLEDSGYKVRDRLMLDMAATIITDVEIDRELTSNLTARCGSTSKGVGAARSARIWRTAQIARDVLDDRYEVRPSIGEFAKQRLRGGATVQIEGTQGYGLGLYGPSYPYTTSSDCTAISFLSMAQISPWATPNLDLQVWVVLRPFPIRVAGNSGPLFSETSWEALGLPPEYTTVTNKMRRVGHWDRLLARGALIANGCTDWAAPAERYEHQARCPVRVAVTMMDQVEPAVAGSTQYSTVRSSTRSDAFLTRVSDDVGHYPDLITTSDRTAIDIRSLAYGL